MKASGFSAYQLRYEGNYSDSEILSAGYTAAELKAANYTAADIKAVGS
jgi:hypothetical protein